VDPDDPAALADLQHQGVGGLVPDIWDLST
jgi:hypothetical protein